MNPPFQVISPNRRKKSLDEKEEGEIMDTAEDIVFRPLFRYRQETRLRPKSPPSYSRRDYQDSYQNSDYDN